MKILLFGLAVIAATPAYATEWFCVDGVPWWVGIEGNKYILDTGNQTSTCQTASADKDGLGGNGGRISGPAVGEPLGGGGFHDPFGYDR